MLQSLAVPLHELKHSKVVCSLSLQVMRNGDDQKQWFVQNRDACISVVATTHHHQHGGHYIVTTTTTIIIIISPITY